MARKEIISVRGARVHNLKNISVEIPKNQLVVITGLSGSGKSSLAFDTIFAEGQRRYVDSLSSYARQFLEIQDRPDVDEITGLSPTIAIDQKTSSHNPRSTVGTITEIYDYLRVLFARAGRPHCPQCGALVIEQTTDQIIARASELLKETDLQIFAPVVQKLKGEHKQVLMSAQSAGFKSVRYDGVLMDTDEAIIMRKEKIKPHDIDVLVAEIMKGEIAKQQIADIVKKGLDYGNGVLIATRQDNGDDVVFSQSYNCPNCLISLSKPEPRMFSFNSPLGACPDCTGLGVKLVLEPELVIPNPRLTLAEGAIKPWMRISGNQNGYLSLLEKVGKKHKFNINTPINKISKDKMEIILRGAGDEIYETEIGAVKFNGILATLEEKYKSTDSDYVRNELETYMRSTICTSCGGKRLRPESLSVLIADRSIYDVVNMSIEDMLAFFNKLKSDETTGKESKQSNLSRAESIVATRVLKEIEERIKNLLAVGLGYLKLDRSAMSLSGGEGQRVRLSSQLGSPLSGVIYILDEPSIGLHPRDNDKLIQTMKRLRDLGNSVIVVEHDKAIIMAADYLIDVGPGAGVYGGEIIFSGLPGKIVKDKDSITGQYISGKLNIQAPKKVRKGSGKKITITGATAFNLKNINVDIPLGQFVCVTGVSGSGKSTLVLDILGKALAKHFYRAKEYPGEHKSIKGLEHIDKVVTVDQSPIGRTPRSNPATYTGVFTPIRDIFTEVPEAKIRGFDAGKFSFNVKGGGRCEACAGDGLKRIEMHFMGDVYVECEVCHGKRYNPDVLEIHYRGKTIADVLDMTVEEARRFFSADQLIFEKLNVLHEVGLGYIKLGQPATTLSGGEAQRVKLATELARRATGRTLYILDEPTTGLHFEDIKRLLAVLNQLVLKGNTIVVIEHNLDVIKVADWVIDLGPDGGAKGGEVLAAGTPKEVAKNKKSWTGKYLREVV